MLNFVIIENDKNLLDNLSKILESIFIKYDFNAQIGLATADVDEFLDYINTNRIDVLLLGIDFKSNSTGLKIAEKVRKINKDCYLIIETAYLEYALIAYKYKTFDFICKPITYKKLEDSIIRLFDDVSKVTKGFINVDNKNNIIAEDEIKYIEKQGTKLIFHTASRDYETYNSFSKIQDKLPNNFVRCHKSFIANIDNIINVKVTDNTIHFDDCYCDIGPKYKNDFLEVLDNRGNLN